jgi:hypothetical protein
MGKYSIVYVIGLSLLVAYVMVRINASSSDSVGNVAGYLGRTKAHNVALAGANLATQRVTSGTGWTGWPTSLLTGSFDGGRFAVKDSQPTSDVVLLISVGSDTIYNNISGFTLFADTVKVTLTRPSLASYAYFSEDEVSNYMSPTSNVAVRSRMWKVTGDQFIGRAHTNGYWNLDGSPLFSDKVTATSAPATGSSTGPYNPSFLGGFDWNAAKVNRPPSNLDSLKSAAIAGSLAPGLGYINSGQSVALTFYSDGTVNVRIPSVGVATTNQTLPITSITSTGVIAVENGDVRVSGTYKGQVTVAAYRTNPTSLTGNVWIDGDIVANDNPQTNPFSTDKLGLVAERMAYVTTEDPVTGNWYPRNSSSVINIQAAIYTQNGTFAAQDFLIAPNQGRINLFGALSMSASTSTGTMGGGGFRKTIAQDYRYAKIAPPRFPKTDSPYQVVAWWEK